MNGSENDVALDLNIMLLILFKTVLYATSKCWVRSPGYNCRPSYNLYGPSNHSSRPIFDEWNVFDSTGVLAIIEHRTERDWRDHRVILERSGLGTRTREMAFSVCWYQTPFTIHKSGSNPYTFDEIITEKYFKNIKSHMSHMWS